MDIGTQMSGRHPPGVAVQGSVLSHTRYPPRPLTRAENTVLTNLAPDNLDWAIAHLTRYGDTDLFPTPFEFALLKEEWKSVQPRLTKIDIGGHQWGAARQIIVQKDEVAFRRTTQLDPLDAVLLAAIIREIGKTIEARRARPVKRVVFSYRFSPTKAGRLYRTERGWEQFWRTSQILAQKHEFVVLSDITDFYNQVYHHEIENQLQAAKVAKPYITAIMNLLGSVTEKVSRGLPVGPHSTHLLAELAMVPVDDRMMASGFPYCRYVDDMHIFVDTRKDAQIALGELTSCVDTFQKLTLNRGKTKILTSAAFVAVCDRMLIDNPINDAEEAIIEAIREASDDPYSTVSLQSIPRRLWHFMDEGCIRDVLESYIEDESDIDFVRLRWFLRRLTQVGVPGGVEFLVEHAELLAPALSEITRYISSARQRFTGKWPTIGDRLLDMLDDPIVKTSEYMQMLIANVFETVTELNHIGNLTRRFDSVGPWCRREIVLAAATANSQAWVRTQKEKFSGADSWMRRAILYAARSLPDDERKFWLRQTKPALRGLIEELIFDCVKQL
jgi:Reverse transcriptase (RNA-dependent DNA polymerase)